MKTNIIFRLIVLLAIFMVAFTLEIMPWPKDMQGWRPAWVVILIVYWSLALPHKINIGSAFVIGIVWDVILGSVLGIHALVLSIAIYIVVKHHLILRNMSLWFQAILIMGYVALIRIMIFFIELILHNAHFHSQELLGAVISGLLWPWIYLLMQQIRRGLWLTE
ncbi:rod shape-determining protein MreD [Phocoenobacter skyensis]|uniref:Rod shape-determining protein MreD n=1 Tax=Phocoenobacter skyensis TaxID=97481 RepID=A0A1H7ZM47_9PAST|nr:rod shape-determining protein MreD [Pasteurella skyensis]MDP8080291.1 rod shape-determining protein MreD [Pasteurella skyensis]MDP8086285.1 rod shape-determining protein MreD [Pasteurella skyensis]MDP8171019.1 rod shape-determining protein MreD [Pasteurella skyensis]MDP8174657.1 rod shape-determining protein MreD [Pasteurella skyensis]MDP8184637.1 rod shape-determining protein MreD [Pasteurella skyensis]